MPAPPSRVRAVARTEALLIFGLLAFAGAAIGGERLLGLAAPVTLPPPVALALLLIPAFLWLGFFYLQDRLEPEPKHFVLGVFLLGGFVAWPVAGWIAQLAPLPAWEGERITVETVIAAVLPLGLAQELAKYLVVRYSVYVSAEFDEPLDGIIYMTAAGIGFATAQNLDHVAHVGAMHLGAFAVNAVVTTLAHGSIAGVLGYAMGLARFGPTRRRAPVVLVGLLVAGALNGAFGLLEVLVRVDGMRVAPWRGVAFAAGFAACVFAATMVLVRRHLGAAARPPSEEEPRWQGHDLHILAAVVLLLAVGFAAGARADRHRVKAVNADGMQLMVPSDWLTEPLLRDASGQIVLRGEDAVTRVELRSGPPPGDLVPLDGGLELERGQRYGGMYQRLETGKVTVAGHEWLRTHYAYAFKPTPTHAPRAAHAVEYALTGDGRLLVVTVHAPEEHIAELERQILGSLVLR